MATKPPPEWHRTMREITAAGFRRMEVERRANDAWSVKRPQHLDLEPTPRYRHPITGRHEFQPPPELVEIGRYFRKARRYAVMSQQRLAERSGVSQSMISRFERGLAPAMGVRHIVALAAVLGRLFPFGTCPHDHECGWQPIRPPERHVAYAERMLEMLGCDDAFDKPTPALPNDSEPMISVTLDDLSVGSEDGRPA